MNNRLYVGNISFSTTKESLQAAFAPVGEVRDIALPTDRETGRMRGFAFVTMGSDAEAQSAVAQMNGLMVDGRPLRVNIAEERAARGAEGGGARRRF